MHPVIWNGMNIKYHEQNSFFTSEQAWTCVIHLMKFIINALYVNKLNKKRELQSTNLILKTFR